MRRRFLFSRKKFSSLSTLQQHKKRAELLRSAYAEVYLRPARIERYNEWQSWLGEKPLETSSEEEIADRYHHHMQRANLSSKEHHFLPKIQRGDRTTSAAPLPITIYLENLRSAHNVGSIFRTTEALAIGSIALSPTTPGPDNKKVADAAMGTEAWVNCSRITELSELPRPLIALETCEQSASIADVRFPPSFTLALGNEEYGCSKNLLQNADQFVQIPLFGRKNSLNVANAFAITAATIVQQLHRI